MGPNQQCKLSFAGQSSWGMKLPSNAQVVQCEVHLHYPTHLHSVTLDLLQGHYLYLATVNTPKHLTQFGTSIKFNIMREHVRPHRHTQFMQFSNMQHIVHSVLSSLMANRMEQYVTGWTVWGSNPGEGKTFCMCPEWPKAHLASRTMRSHTLSQGKWPGHGVNHPPTSKKEYSCTSTNLMGLHGLLEGELCLLMSILYMFIRHISKCPIYVITCH
jgi:hypothetical protein